MNWTEIVIHHSAELDTPAFNTAAIKRYHTKTLKMVDVGYHALVEFVEDDWFVTLGRRWHVAGAHTIGHNGTALGLCFVGNYSLAPPAGGMLAKGAEVVRLWQSIYSIPFEAIHKHSEFNATECPGNLFPWVKFIRLCGGK
jgi:hypothetical protein